MYGMKLLPDKLCINEENKCFLHNFVLWRQRDCFSYYDKEHKKSIIIKKIHRERIPDK